MRVKVWNWALAAAVSVTLAGCGKKETMVERYPGPWQSSENARLRKVLEANKATGCETLYWRTYHNEPTTDYLVYCSPDGKTWTAWLVWTSIKQVVGPTDVFPDIAPPKAPIKAAE